MRAIAGLRRTPTQSVGTLHGAEAKRGSVIVLCDNRVMPILIRSGCDPSADNATDTQWQTRCGLLADADPREADLALRPREASRSGAEREHDGRRCGVADCAPLGGRRMPPGLTPRRFPRLSILLSNESGQNAEPWVWRAATRSSYSNATKAVGQRRSSTAMIASTRRVRFTRARL
jgi:hypothetical protein